MILFHDKGWFLGVVAFVMLFTGSTMLFSGELTDQSGLIKLSDLSDSDIEMILAVKTEMQAAKIQSN